MLNLFIANWTQNQQQEKNAHCHYHHLAPFWAFEPLQPDKKRKLKKNCEKAGDTIIHLVHVTIIYSIESTFFNVLNTE